LDEDIPVLAVKFQTSDAVEAVLPAEARMGAPSVQKTILGLHGDQFCQNRLSKLDALSPHDPRWSRKAVFFREMNGLL